MCIRDRAKAVVDAASKKGLSHEEMHTKVEYIVAHGIATSINGKRTVIGSYHFVFEDEKCVVPEMCIRDRGDVSAKALGCDLTYDYVKINGDYRS